MKKNKFLKVFVVVLAAAIVLSGCSFKSKNQVVKPEVIPSNGEEPPKTIEEKVAVQTKLKKFSSMDELEEFLASGLIMSSLSFYEGNFSAVNGTSNAKWGRVADVETLKTEEKTTAAAQSIGAGSDSYSKTNVQVEGVDEADIIKTDGKYVYAMAKNSLFIIEAQPAETARILSKIEFKSRPENIYINGDYLAVYGRNGEIYKEVFYRGFKRQNDYTFLKVFDLTDRKNPKQVRNLDFEGSYADSRMIGDYIYFVTANYAHNYISGEPLLPRIVENGQVISKECQEAEKCDMADVYYFDIPYDTYNFTTITAINVKNGTETVESDTYLMAGNQNMYVSKNNIYVTYTKYVSEYDMESEILKELISPRLSEKDRDKITTIEGAENFILSPAEKTQKIRQILERYVASLNPGDQEKLAIEIKSAMQKKYDDISKELEKTVIHKIGINGKNFEYKAFGEVTGQILNQFSMDEHEGYFRIATTKNSVWSEYEKDRVESYNNLYVLDENLKTVGALEDLASGERIYSVRFMQNRAYMVTFKQVDPLFVIDLANPQEPKVLGKLKIPGFSNYLHPYDNNTLIGIGKHTYENERGGISTGGLKLSLFDVSNVSDPKEKDTYVLEEKNSDSIALSDHKAFLFDRGKNLLSIPASLNAGGGLSFSGVLVFRVDESGFELKGRIDHSNGGQGSDRDYWQGLYYYDNTVKRSLYIGDILYTFSNNYLKMNKLGDLSPVNDLELKKGAEYDYTVVN
ncbi:hypothetical protein A2303_05405 [Candidatus Falkowbacteria bacterium RIFOXYB2_FULL_47_14]|uniref:Copper amine oxidase-like N-terminal domain-containing protein n=1 Tax=Candidatus Falkowbacteria bacterium RIFOXYA2_FULL_47_19 TaxID=1797994 RepID=A0A1F5SLG5_9BACT|nr:MAG: hypothetical protein A2227_02125 [Candidatus Falkowbacteria bacterium RIFOXYA2_FULL_47_19]OGF36908.1 MAG: hypothetical protein A2468_08070 [Candidatus Falkowbacteria bacterium RIFOXYC2_FULL_46_15]OGF43287.1 MAG: hypothetical protein A2303_05405 [Candidatus Falkowbacteria bacterium RIFOXYB2_FULL_47_14]